MSDHPSFISVTHKDRLRLALSLIENVHKEITLEQEEYTAIDTTLYYLKNAINYEEKYF